MTRSLLMVGLSAAVVFASTAAVAAPLASGPPSVQGGVTARNVFETSAVPLRSKAERQAYAELRRLRAEVKASMARNGGALPEAERAAYQQRFDTLKQALRDS